MALGVVDPGAAFWAAVCEGEQEAALAKARFDLSQRSK